MCVTKKTPFYTSQAHTDTDNTEIKLNRHPQQNCSGNQKKCSYISVEVNMSWSGDARFAVSFQYKEDWREVWVSDSIPVDKK